MAAEAALVVAKEVKVEQKVEATVTQIELRKHFLSTRSRWTTTGRSPLRKTDLGSRTPMVNR
jgi:hypothetical protein